MASRRERLTMQGRTQPHTPGRRALPARPRPRGPRPRVRVVASGASRLPSRLPVSRVPPPGARSARRSDAVRRHH